MNDEKLNAIRRRVDAADMEPPDSLGVRRQRGEEHYGNWYEVHEPPEHPEDPDLVDSVILVPDDDDEMSAARAQLLLHAAADLAALLDEVGRMRAVVDAARRRVQFEQWLPDSSDELAAAVHAYDRQQQEGGRA